MTGKSQKEQAKKEGFVFVYSPRNAQELAFVKMVLGGIGIRYYIQGESFYTVMIHLQPLNENEVRVIVETLRAEKAKTLLSSHLA